MQETWVCSLGQEDPLEKGMATHFSVIAWRIPWTEESGRLQSMVLQRVGHDWVTNTLWEAYWFFSVVGNISLEASKSFLSLPLSLPDSLSLTLSLSFSDPLPFSLALSVLFWILHTMSEVGRLSTDVQSALWSGDSDVFSFGFSSSIFSLDLQLNCC